MLAFDTHAHLDEESLIKEVDVIVENALQSGVANILTIGTTLESSRRSIQLAEQFPSVYAAVGIHPNYASQAKPNDWEQIVELTSHEKVIAVGETGLDCYWDFAPLDVQQEYFDRHLELSHKTGLPFIVHCRDAEPQVVEQLQAAAQFFQNEGEPYKLNGIMHSFCGSAETAKACLELGMHISLSGMVTYKKNDELRAIVGELPQDRLLIETDSPYLVPHPERKKLKRNEPAFVVSVSDTLAEVFGTTPDEMGELTTKNARRLFKI